MGKSLEQLKKDVQTKIDFLRTIYTETIDFNIKYDLDSKRKVGTISYNKNSDYRVTMNLNADLLLEYGDAYINEIVVHEFAHVVIESFYKFHTNKRGKSIRPHGTEWKRVMYTLGVDDARATTTLCENSKTLETKKRKKTRYTYSCSCTDHHLSKIRHNKIVKRNGVHFLSCKKCKTALKFTGEEVVTYE